MDEFKSIIEEYTPMGGSTIKDSILIAQRRAKEKDCLILLNFNGISIVVEKHSNCEFLEKYYYYELRIDKYKILLR